MIVMQPVILFDGICNLCNSSVQFIIKHDPHAVFKFASLQSEQGRMLLKKYQFADNDLTSFVLIMNNKVYTKSTAALQVLKQLKGALSLLYGFIIVPAFIRDAVYNMVAKHRYKWFGKRNECMVPSPSLQNRFLN